MKYLIVGGSGMLGIDLSRVLAGRTVTSLSRAELDVSHEEAVRAAVSDHDVVINAAAFTNVDAAESNEEAANRANSIGALNLAKASAENGATLVQVSTDYVFDGSATSPYQEDAPLNPVSAYGRTKADGERHVLQHNPKHSYIVRTAWLYGAHGPNFPKTMIRLASERDEIAVVTDQVGQPTWTLDLARQIVALVDSGSPAGTYHGTNGGEASWFDFARAVFVGVGLDPDRIRPTDSSQFVRPAPRPAYSVLGHDGWRRAHLEPMRDWREALSDAIASGVFGHALPSRTSSVTA